MCMAKELNQREEIECGVRVSGMEYSKESVEGD